MNADQNLDNYTHGEKKTVESTDFFSVQNCNFSELYIFRLKTIFFMQK